MRANVIVTTLLAAVAASSVASAQEAVTLREPAPRQGYYIGGGTRLLMGGGATDKVGGLGPMFGFGGVFRFGQMATDWLGLGLVLGGGSSFNGTWGAGGGHLSVEAQVKPLAEYDLALRGSIGLGAFGLSRVKPEDEREDDPSGGLGAQYTLGASYDLFPFYKEGTYKSGGFAFTGFAEVALLPTSEVWTMNFVIGIEVTYWFGLRKDRLELPPDEAFKAKK